MRQTCDHMQVATEHMAPTLTEKTAIASIVNTQGSDTYKQPQSLASTTHKCTDSHKGRINANIDNAQRVLTLTITLNR